jgi:Fe-S-cluster containining protein
MPLSKEDIEHIKRSGFDYSYFVVNRDGWLQLKNYDGRCVLNDGQECLIYENRPKGCEIYPVVYDEDKSCATLDEDCLHRDEFKISKTDQRMASSLLTKLKDDPEEIEKLRRRISNTREFIEHCQKMQ